MQKKLIYFIIAFAIAIYLSCSWFHYRTLLATAEEAIPFYNSIRTFHLYTSPWVEAGFGFASPFFIPRLVLYGFAAAFAYLGLSGWAIQAFIFFLLILSPLLIFPFLINFILRKDSLITGITAGMFYIANLYVISQVWQRFIYPLIFLWSFLPLFVYLWFRWFESKKNRYISLLLLATFFYSDVFGLTTSFFVLIFIILTIGAYAIIGAKEKVKEIYYVVGSLGIWLVAQLWWLYPLWALRNNSYSSFLKTNDNLQALKEVTQFYPNVDIFLLKQEYFFGKGGALYSFYQYPLMHISMWLVVSLVILGIFLSKSRLSRWKYFLSIFIISWIVVKGFNPPFGKEIYTFFFTNVPLLQIFRNPYEKFGTVWVFVYTIFFSLGISFVIDRIKIVFLKYVTWVVFIGLFCGIFAMPLWSGKLFPNYYHVVVPTYYSSANAYLNARDNHRILQTPMLRESYLRTTWNYKGEEPSEFLFDRMSLSRSDFGKPTDDFYLTLPLYFTYTNFPHILALAGVSDVVVHEDTWRNPYNQESSYDMQSLISNWQGISTDKQIGKLHIYSLPKGSVRDFISVADDPIFVSNIKEGFDNAVKDNFDPLKNIFIIRKTATKSIEQIRLSAPSFTYRKLSATHYKVNIKDATKPFILILSMSYNKQWEARIEKNILSQKFEVNGFADGWLVDKKGNYTIDIVFPVWPWD